MTHHSLSQKTAPLRYVLYDYFLFPMQWKPSQCRQSYQSPEFLPSILSTSILAPITTSREDLLFYYRSNSCINKVHTSLNHLVSIPLLNLPITAIHLLNPRASHWMELQCSLHQSCILLHLATRAPWTSVSLLTYHLLISVHVHKALNALLTPSP